MAYTVTKLAKISKVSIRTLHWYDEIGLLKPAYHGANGYRYYEEPQLLILQQILFFRELGFELSQIQKILSKSDFDRVSALSSHRKVLKQNINRTQRLIQTIDKTIEHLKGIKKMKSEEIYLGFSKEKQHEYQTYLINRFGGKIKDSIEESHEKVKKMSQQDLEKSKKEFPKICEDLASHWKNHFSADSQEVQKIIRRHYEWIKQYWTPDRESYIGLGQGYTGFEWKNAFETYDSEHPKFAQFLAEAMEVFANSKLS